MAAERWQSFLGRGRLSNLRWFTNSTEFAAVFWAMIMGFFIYKELTIRSLGLALKDTATITAIIFAATATFLSVVLTYSQSPLSVSSQHGSNIHPFLGRPCYHLPITGDFVEIVPVFYLTVPIFAAITLSFNQSLLHLYVVFVAFAGIAKRYFLSALGLSTVY